MGAKSSKPSSVLLVGSFPGSNEEEVFRRACKVLPGRLETIPDGETGHRAAFTTWQLPCFPSEVLRPFFKAASGSEQNGDAELKQGQHGLEDVKPTGYDTAAIESYKTFKRLRDEEGLIPKGTRFQVSVPGPWSGSIFVEPSHLATILPLYTQRLCEAITEIQKQIPAQDLAIQLDLAVEVAVIEAQRGRLTGPMWSETWVDDADPLQCVVSWVPKLAQTVTREALLGLHLCYGDIEHQHFMQPPDLTLLVDLANVFVDRLQVQSRPVDWIHMPVPKDRTDAAYFEPLKNLRFGSANPSSGTKTRSGRLYLGLIHARDEVGTKKRLEIAQKYYKGPIGVAAECGFGRSPVEDVDSILEVTATVTAPAGSKRNSFF